MTTLNANAAKVLALMAATGAPTMDQLPPRQARLVASMGIDLLQTKPEAVAEVRALKAGDVPLRFYRPAGSTAAQTLPGLVFLHGGGFTVGDLDLYDVLCRRLSNGAGCAVVLVDYRLAPEHPFPAAVEDAYGATCWVADNAAALGIDPARLAIGGDSAGGNLSAVVCLMARDQGGPKICLQVLMYPATVMDAETPAHRENASGYFLTADLMRYFLGHYVPNPADLGDWRVSPLNAKSHAGLPPAYVLVCGFDPLRDDGLRYADALKAAGVPVTLSLLPDQIHGFLSMDAMIPEAGKAIDAMNAALRAAFTV